METKHTPGPWSVAIGDGCFVVETNDAFIRFVIHGSNQEGDEANARLIAAAPELLQAAKDFVEWFECSRIGDKPIAELSHARAAIAKATGETS
jgi:hypothetical protein